MFELGVVKKAVIWNTTSQLIGKIVGGGVALLISLLIASASGAQGYGEFSLVTTYVAFFYLFADFGLNAIFLQQSNGLSKKELAPSWSELLLSRGLFSFVLVFLALIILVFLPQGVNQGYTNVVRLGIIIYLPTIIFQGVLTSSNAIFQKELRYDYSTLATSLGAIFSLVLIWFLTRTNLVLATPLVLIALTLGSLATALLSLLLAQKITGPFIFSFKFEKFKKLFWLSFPLGLTLIFNLIYFRADNVILGLTRNTTEVGFYSLAYKVFEFALVFPTFFMNSMFPLFLKAKGQQTKDYYQLIKKSGFILVAVSLLLVLLVWSAAPLLILIKPEFVNSVSALRILAFGLPFFFLSSLVMWVMIAQKQQKQLAMIYFTSMILILVLDWILLPRFGYLAAAWMTVVGEGIVLLLSGSFLINGLKNK